MKIGIKIVQSLLIVVIAIFITSNTSVLESKIENTNINTTVNLSTMAMKIADNEYDKLYTPLSTLTGELTGYVYNCPLCTGRLACMSSLDLSNGTNTYVDEEYGEVAIVASSTSVPCGTVLTFESSRVSEEPVYAIVLDRGVGGNSLDLLVKDLDYAYSTVGRSTITYSIVRSGW